MGDTEERVQRSPWGFGWTVTAEAEDIERGRQKMELPPASGSAETIRVVQHAHSQEPSVEYTPFDRAAIALSGGGIRSASFSLGLLQALSERKVLPLFDYLSTVSGGGYTGGFWSSWARANGAEEHFPGARKNGGTSHEHPAIRHLREFSRFLAPRTGVGYSDLWEAVLALLAGLVPTLVFASALFATGVVVWRIIVDVVVWLALHSWQLPAFVFVAFFGLAVATERLWQRMRITPPHRVRWPTVLGSALLTSSVFALLTAAVVRPESAVWTGDALSPTNPQWPEVWAKDTRYLVTGLERIHGYLLPAGLACGAAAIWAVRWFGDWWVGWVGVFRDHDRAMSRADDPASMGRALERASARLLLLAMIALVFAVIWHLADVLAVLVPKLVREYLGISIDPTTEAIGVTGGLAAVATATFGALRGLLQPSRSDDAAGLLARLRPALPQIAAAATVLLYLTAVTIGCRALDRYFAAENLSPWFWVGAPLLVAFLMGSDHSGTGLREFYRRRISRAFVQYDGDKRPPDCDLLAPLRPKLTRPVHLVCCAANSVADDPLRTLYRGARSAVLSPHGLHIGNRRTHHEIRLSDALTASAAAFNSQMGGNSLRLGAAVSILMTALNLRLGLWLRTTPMRSPLALGGIRLFAEMFGITRADHGWVHLSDGGHFDNCGAYELVRRHCRYIVIADCGADPKVRFDDLSDLIRRVREDFGVEIEIDVSPLRPDANGYSRQHVAVGKIFYGLRATVDVGTIVVIKPTLTGDEPPDVTQYRARNSAFPHESTGDQFFDEPQWESYRRLGEHIGRQVFAYVQDLSDDQRREGERVFSEAARQWHPLPAEFRDRLAALAERFTALESELHADMPANLLAELVPELAKNDTERPPADDAKTFLYLVAVVQMLEDIWLTCDLDAHDQHPINEGWSSYLARWATTASFERMWPLLRPLVAPGFREFIKRRFGLRVLDESELSSPSDAARIAVLRLEPRAESDATYQITYRLTLPEPCAPPIEVGHAHVECRDGCAVWRLEDVVVPARLHGAGVVGRFVDALVKWCRDNDMRHIAVRVSTPAPGVRSADYNRMMDVYRGRGFRLSASCDALECDVVLTRSSTSPSA